MLNLRFDSDFTRRLGLENHVCEVQLVHAAFSAVTKASSHGQYTEFRDLRDYVRPSFVADRQMAAVYPEPECLEVRALAALDNTTIEQDACTSVHCGSVCVSSSHGHSDHSGRARAGYDAGGAGEVGSPSEEVLQLDSPSTVTEPSRTVEISHYHSEYGRCCEVGPCDCSQSKQAPVLSVPYYPLAAPSTLRPPAEPASNDNWSGFSLPEECTGFPRPGPWGSGSGRGLDARLRNALESAALHVYLRFTLGAVGALDRHASDFAEALNKSSSHSVLFSSKPHSAYAAKPMGKVRTLLISIGWLIFAAIQLSDALADGAGLLAPSLLRLRPFAHAGSVLSTGTNVVARFGLLRDDCVVSSSKDYGSVSGDPLANGYHFALSTAEPLAAEIVGWAVEGSQDNGSSWAPVAPCTWVTVQTWSEGNRAWMVLGGPSSWLTDCIDGGVRGVALGAGAQVRVGFAQGEGFAWLSIGFLVIPLGWLCALIAAMLGRVHLFRPILVVTLAAWAAWSLGWQAAAWPAAPDVRRPIYLMMMWNTLPAAICALGFHLMERRLVFVFLADGLLFLFSFVLTYVENFGLLDLRPVLSIPACIMSLVLGLYLTGSAVTFFFLRWRVLRRARLLVLDDRRRYDAFWTEVLRSQAADCLELRAQAHALAARLPAGPPQQMTSSGRVKPASLHAYSLVAVSAAMNPFSIWQSPVPQSPAALFPLFSLDQLFVQAICTQPLLLSKVQQWAAASGGLFPCQRPHPASSGRVVFAQFTEADMGSGPDKFKWCRLKSVPRAVEKVIRAYELDVSRLVDVCRQVGIPPAPPLTPTFLNL